MQEDTVFLFHGYLYLPTVYCQGARTGIVYRINSKLTIGLYAVYYTLMCVTDVYYTPLRARSTLQDRRLPPFVETLSACADRLYGYLMAIELIRAALRGLDNGDSMNNNATRALVFAVVIIILIFGALVTSLVSTTPPIGSFAYDLSIRESTDKRVYEYVLTSRGADGDVFLSVSETFSLPVSLSDGESTEAYSVAEPKDFKDVLFTLDAQGEKPCQMVDGIVGPFYRDDGSSVYTATFSCSNP